MIKNDNLTNNKYIKQITCKCMVRYSISNKYYGNSWKIINTK